jgi:ribonuclease PH
MSKRTAVPRPPLVKAQSTGTATPLPLSSSSSLSSRRLDQGRSLLDIRPVTIDLGVNRYAEGSALIRAGNTHVLCTASIENSVPAWLVGKGSGWISAEYAMLPRATHTRSPRDRQKISGRTQEIQRLIGRALRNCIDLKKLGERTLLIDCDVLQADGGTRTASITGGCVALAGALGRLIAQGKVPREVWVDSVFALSVGVYQNQVLVDLDYEEDSSCEVDMNFVMNGSGKFVEIQGTGEKSSFSEPQLLEMIRAAQSGLSQVQTVQKAILTGLV